MRWKIQHESSKLLKTPSLFNCQSIIFPLRNNFKSWEVRSVLSPKSGLNCGAVIRHTLLRSMRPNGSQQNRQESMLFDVADKLPQAEKEIVQESSERM